MAGVDLAMEGIPRGSGIFKTAAIYVLRKEKRLLTTGQITRYALENDLLGNLPGKTPEATMASACYTDLKKKDVNKRVFARPSEGHFGLREWANDPELTHLLQPKLHRLAETFEEEQKPKVEKPWKQPAPMAKRKNNTAAKKFVDGKPRRDRHGFVHAIIEPSRGEYGPPKMQMPPPQQQYGSLSTHDTMDLDALVDAAANQEDEDDYRNNDNDENDDQDGNGAYNGGNDDHEEEDANTKDQSGVTAGVDKSFDNDPNAEEASPSKTNIIRNNNNDDDDDVTNNSNKMKFTAFAAIIASASAFAPMSANKASSAIKASVEGLPGALDPVGFFDPLGFAEKATPATLKRYREAELAHGRVSMLAVIGFLVGEQVEGSSFLFDASISGPAITHITQVPDGFWAVIIAFIGAYEATRAETGWVDPADCPVDQPGLLRDDYLPGDLKFDPLGLKPEDDEEFALMQTKELQNGRLAMLAAAGFLAQEAVDGQGIVEHLQSMSA